MTRIHPTAVVDPRAKLADDVVLGPYVVIGGDVELAAGVEVGPHATVTGRTRIGPRTRIWASCVVGAEPQIYGGPAAAGELVIGADNTIREFSSVHAGSPGGGGLTRIGDGNLLMNHVHVAHDCQVGSHCIVGSYTGMGGHVEIQDYAVTGGMTGIHQYVRVGESAFTAGGARVSKDAPPFSRVAGDRARFAGINVTGLERRGLRPEVIAALKHAFHLLHTAKLRLEQALSRIEEECGEVPEVARLLGFLKSSRRGVIR